MVNALALTRMEIGLSRREFAALAGVPQSTITRIETGEVSPSASTLNRILANVGRTATTELADLVDMTAVIACRTIIDPTLRLSDSYGLERWIEVWKRARFLNADNQAVKPARLAQLAATNARLVARPGQQQFAPIPADTATGVLANAGIGYALTGSAAANRIKLTGSEPWTVIYVDDLAAAGALFGPPISRYNPRMTLIASTPITRLGVWADTDGVTVADPIQVLIDLYAGSDRMPDQADLLAAYFDRQANDD